MASRPDGLDLRRFRKFANLLDSPEAGERLAALEQANALLRGAGSTWRKLLDELGGELAHDDDKAPAAGHVAEAADYMRRGRGVLTAFEVKFLLGIASFRTLSPKQRATLDDISNKVQLAEAAGRAAA